MTTNKEKLIELINELAKELHETSRSKGFYNPPPSDLERFALMHSEISEATEGVRHGNPPSDHIPEFSATEEEMADTIIRILDYAVYRNLRIGEAIFAKAEFNKGRPFMHGGKTA
jgi:NTP pyrophosphatase (non-canonical NTP hydrolase)